MLESWPQPNSDADRKMAIPIVISNPKNTDEVEQISMDEWLKYSLIILHTHKQLWETSDRGRCC